MFKNARSPQLTSTALKRNAVKKHSFTLLGETSTSNILRFLRYFFGGKSNRAVRYRIYRAHFLIQIIFSFHG